MSSLDNTPLAKFGYRVKIFTTWIAFLVGFILAITSGFLLFSPEPFTGLLTGVLSGVFLGFSTSLAKDLLKESHERDN